MGATIKEIFSGNPDNNLIGVVTGSVTCVAFPAQSAKLLRFKADPGNVGVHKLGVVGTGECLWPMAAGDDTGWIAPPYIEGNLAGLNSYKHSNASGSVDFLYYWIQR
jgi:hypothetical protein